MQMEEASQYKPRFQSAAAKQAVADARLQRNRIAGKISRFSNCKVDGPYVDSRRLVAVLSERNRRCRTRRNPSRMRWWKAQEISFISALLSKIIHLYTRAGSRIEPNHFCERRAVACPWRHVGPGQKVQKL